MEAAAFCQSRAGAGKRTRRGGGQEVGGTQGCPLPARWVTGPSEDVEEAQDSELSSGACGH